uniref:ACYPI007929 protein n=1 Tax=Acyrthosiphon pisum TaxID=7029 RepID=C4WW77_ACYPI|nr:ACYPI007929 [Acyrthosiphon pisum]
MDSTLNVSRSVDTMSMINQSTSIKDSLDLSGKMLDRFFAADDSFPTLVEKMQITKSSQSVSGCTEYDYPKEGSGMPSITPLKSRHKVPLPEALLEQWNDVQNFHRKLGIFPEINRVWVTIDQEFFLWDYSEGTDLSYFDGMSSTIFAVALVQPKPNVFQPHIKHLLVLDCTMSNKSIVVIILLVSILINFSDSVVKRCFSCRSRGDLGSCKDRFKYTNLTQVSLESGIGVEAVPCASGWWENN